MIGLIPEPVFMAVFAGAFIVSGVYLFCVFRLGENLRDLKRRGRALDAPDIHFSAAGVSGVIWLVTGRYARVGDEAVTRWSSFARILLFLYFPVFLLIFANVLLHVLGSPKA